MGEKRQDLHLAIRRYDASDHAAVVRLHRTGLEQMGADAGPGPWDADLDDVVGSYIDVGGEFVVGLIGGEVVAMGALRPLTETTAELKRLRVKQELQGEGIGERVARFLIERARERGLVNLRADTTTRQLPAQRLLRKLGFLETRRRQFERFELIYYERSLDVAENSPARRVLPAGERLRSTKNLDTEQSPLEMRPEQAARKES